MVDESATSASAANSASAPDRLRAGAATEDITPTGSVFLYGYPHVPRSSTGVHDPLECAVLYLESGAGRTLFVAVDLIWVGKPLVAAARREISERTSVPEDVILISATHTHSGPVTADLVSNAADPVVPSYDPAYLAHCVEQIAVAAERAVQEAQPAEIGLAVAQVEGVGTNRHDPIGPTDSDVPVLVARAVESGRPLGCLLVYGMHPTVLHEDSTLVSADFPYFTRRYLRTETLTADCPILYHQGAAGNQSPRHVTTANTFAEAERLGDLLGQAVATAISEIRYVTTATIACLRTELILEPRSVPTVPEAEAMLAAKLAHIEELRSLGAPRQEIRTAECDCFGGEETLELAKAATDGRLDASRAICQPAEVQVIAIGLWRFIGWPGEFFVEYALEVKRRSNATGVITLANGDLQGYIVTEKAAEQGVYESGNAVFAAANGQRFVEASLALLQKLD